MIDCPTYQEYIYPSEELCINKKYDCVLIIGSDTLILNYKCKKYNVNLSYKFIRTHKDSCFYIHIPIQNEKKHPVFITKISSLSQVCIADNITDFDTIGPFGYKILRLKFTKFAFYDDFTRDTLNILKSIIINYNYGEGKNMTTELLFNIKIHYLKWD